MSEDQYLAYGATFFFVLAVLHTFSVKGFMRLAGRFPEGSVQENLFHLLGEVEVVFGIWAGLFVAYSMMIAGFDKTLDYLQARNFTEPAFVFVVMTICATQPVLSLSEKLIRLQGRILPLPAGTGFYFAALTVGPLLGSFITEPAAMTVTALILLKSLYVKNISTELKYATLGLLFVNVSIGGTLTPFAAPPVLMVAPVWHWDLPFMFSHFGWKAIVAIVCSTSLVTFRFRKELAQLPSKQDTSHAHVPWWITALHFLVLAGTVLASHHMVLFVGMFLFFLGVVSVTREFQVDLKLKESLLVGFFLAGLVVLGGYQRWWLEMVLAKLSAVSLYFGAIGLTAFTDNAAITYLGSQVPGLSEISKYALVAGSVVGGGLTVIANAPNPAGFSTLNPTFGHDGISPILLFRSALIPTLIAGICFWFL